MRLKGIRKSCILFIVIIIALAVTVCFIVYSVRPMMLELAIAETSDVVTLTVNQTISEKLSDGSIRYNDIVSFEKDVDGKITALVTDMSKINALQAEITNEIILKLSDKGETNIKIPIGNFFGSTLLSGKGPCISVNIISVTNVDTEFSNKFSSAGINQTRHQILLDVNIELTILIPGYTSSVMVPTEICVAETIIIGNVPGTYANLD